MGDDSSVNMLWLDSDFPTDQPASKPGVARGPCSTSSGKPADVRKNFPDASVTYSNIKYGTIGSTFGPSPSPPTPPAPSGCHACGYNCHGNCSTCGHCNVVWRRFAVVIAASASAFTFSATQWVSWRLF